MGQALLIDARPHTAGQRPADLTQCKFRALLKTIDIYRGNLKATRDPVASGAFVSFFPQLVAGPIERATNLLPQITSRRTFTYEQGRDGMRLILLGIFKKVVVADSCVPCARVDWGITVDRGERMATGQSGYAVL